MAYANSFRSSTSAIGEFISVLDQVIPIDSRPFSVFDQVFVFAYGVAVWSQKKKVYYESIQTYNMHVCMEI